MGAATVIRDDVAVVTKEGGMGNERARLKRWITLWSWVRTWRRVRRWGSAEGSSDVVSGGA